MMQKLSFRYINPYSLAIFVIETCIICFFTYMYVINPYKIEFSHRHHTSTSIVLLILSLILLFLLLKRILLFLLFKIEVINNQIIFKSPVNKFILDIDKIKEINYLKFSFYTYNDDDWMKQIEDIKQLDKFKNDLGYLIGNEPLIVIGYNADEVPLHYHFTWGLYKLATKDYISFKYRKSLRPFVDEMINKINNQNNGSI